MDYSDSDIPQCKTIDSQLSSVYYKWIALQVVGKLLK